eukprot:CAMPEP_0172668470 /NCGR_PEP_ID=MMETSP1074-20121228/9083_1 /TAXON_ID=2916 /ORGANISM="Ceratium fusus, Strain PA161109" /LENGTH=102 /DNA_ID=CAMNT_0013485123 /DNA_START=806 /DNA_END=1110 /DNA_ORIENTATION=-
MVSSSKISSVFSANHSSKFAPLGTRTISHVSVLPPLCCDVDGAFGFDGFDGAVGGRNGGCGGAIFPPGLPLRGDAVALSPSTLLPPLQLLAAADGCILFRGR